MHPDAFLKAVARRRSRYAIGSDISMTAEEVVERALEVARLVPSSFNGQSCRLVFLFNDQHTRFWEEVKKALRTVTNDTQYKASAAKVSHSMESGAGTILFCIDTEVIDAHQKKFPAYAKNFPTWAQQTSGMTQFAVWTALSEDGIGASLQHYNELIDQAAHEMFDIPPTWKLVAQMPFGSMKGKTGAKTFIPDKKRYMTLGLDSKL